MARQIHTPDMIEGGANVIDLMSSNVAMLIQQIGDFPVTEREFTDTKEYEKFMQDPVVIELHTTTDKNAPPAVFVGVNGDCRWLPRGRPLRLQRKFVERLAQSQETSYSQKENHDRDAMNGIITESTRAGAYPFSVLHDPHPKGRAWLSRVMRQG